MDEAMNYCIAGTRCKRQTPLPAILKETVMNQISPMRNWNPPFVGALFERYDLHHAVKNMVFSLWTTKLNADCAVIIRNIGAAITENHTLIDEILSLLRELYRSDYPVYASHYNFGNWANIRIVPFN